MTGWRYKKCLYWDKRKCCKHAFEVYLLSVSSWSLIVQTSPHKSFLPGWHKSPRISQPVLSKTRFLGNSNVSTATNSAGFTEHYSDGEQSIKLTVEMKASQRRASNSCSWHCLKPVFLWTKNHSTDVPRLCHWSLCTDTDKGSVRQAISPGFLKFLSKTQQLDKNLYQHSLAFIKSYIFPGFRSSTKLFHLFSLKNRFKIKTYIKKILAHSYRLF